MKNLENLRREYIQPEFDSDHCEKDPIQQFTKWFEEISKTDNPEPNSMTLATSSKNGQPSARVVLLKGIENNCFVFYTNYQSLKGKEMEENPKVCLNFYWPELSRQVRIDGIAEKVKKEISEQYFSSRPRGSQIGAWTSPQSTPVESRQILENRYKEIEKRFENKSIKKPAQWGGYSVVPLALEFWQGRENRLHDRILYTPNNGKWVINRLAP